MFSQRKTVRGIAQKRGIVDHISGFGKLNTLMLAVAELKRTWRLYAPRVQFSDENPETKRCKVTTQRPFWLVRGRAMAPELGVSPSTWLPGPLQHLTQLIVKRNTSGYLSKGACSEVHMLKERGLLPRHRCYLMSYRQMGGTSCQLSSLTSTY